MKPIPYSPTPWTASVEPKPEPSKGHWYCIYSAKPEELAEGTLIGEFYGDDHEANVANVKAAAAAPELIEALLALVVVADNGCVCTDCQRVRANAGENAVAALRKAGVEL